MLLPWHGRGRRFDPDQVHHLNQPGINRLQKHLHESYKNRTNSAGIHPSLIRIGFQVSYKMQATHERSCLLLRIGAGFQIHGCKP